MNFFGIIKVLIITIAIKNTQNQISSNGQSLSANKESANETQNAISQANLFNNFNIIKFLKVNINYLSFLTI
jgi:hypothetical protein